MNILMVSDVSISPVIGGAERALFEYSTRLARHGHHVHVLTRRLPWHNEDNEIIEGVSEWRFAFNESNFLSSLYSSVFKSRSLFESLCDKFSFDVINFHQPFTALGVAGSQLSKMIRKVYTCHSLSFEEFESRNPKPTNIIKRFIYSSNSKLRWSIEKNVLNKSDKIVVLSNFTKEKLRTHYQLAGNKISIIPGGVDLDKFCPSSDRSSLRKKFGIPQNKFILFTVRNLVARMGIGNLITAVGKVLEQHPDMYLVIGGKGILKESLESLAQQLTIQDKVKFAGFISEEDLPDYYRLADMFILPTKELEGFGLVTVEALASGLPVLGTPIGGTREILSQLNPEFLFEDCEADAMEKVIKKWVEQFKNNPDSYKEMSTKCRNFAETHYSWEDKIMQLEEEFRTA